MISQEEEDEIRRFHEAMQRILRSKDPDPEGIAYVRSQSERIKELERRLTEERREEQREQRREESREAEERVLHQPHQVIWLQPRCSICDLRGDEERYWSRENDWEGGCERCGAMPVKYVLAPDQPQSKQS
jgi:hypothetical protein